MANKRIMDLLQQASDFSGSDYFVMDSAAGTNKINGDDLKSAAAQYGVAGQASPFDPTVSYGAGDTVSYGARVYTFFTAHPAGVWTGTDVLCIQNLLEKETATAIYGNRLDDSLFSPPGMFLNVDGTAVSHNNFGESGLIPCRPGEVLYFYIDSNSGHENQFYRPICFFDRDRNFLQGTISQAEPLAITVPSQAYYLAVPIYWDSGVCEKAVIADYLPTKFVPYSSNFEIVHKLIGREYDPENLLNPNDPDIQTGGFIANPTGDWISSSIYCESGYIPTRQASILYTFSSNGSVEWGRPWVACYDASKQFITAFDPGSTLQNKALLNIPSGTVYIRIPLLASTKGADKCIGYEPFKRFVPYGKKISFIRNVDMLQALGDNENLPMSQKAVSEAINAISGVDGTQWAGKKWYAYGTSITDTTPTGKYAPYLAAMSGLVLTDKGIGGGGIGDLGGYSHGQVFDAICNITDGKLEADLITLETGANDTAAGVPLGTIYDVTQDTLAGCLNLCIRYLQANTDAQIVVTPSVATTTLPNAVDKYYEWADMIEKICSLNRVYFINPACNLGYGKLSSSKGSSYVVDSIHQTALGGYILAQSMWKSLKTIPNFLTALPST